ncbi:MAG: phosphopantothenoylcysteine decarboxylase [Elusimicrobiota bacterium]
MDYKTILITAGPTREYIDQVRFISNDSSGKTGYLLAEEAKKRGMKVILISGTTNRKPPENIKIIYVISAEQMFGQVKKYFEKCDVFISCAAVSDYRPEKYTKNKIKKTGKSVTLKLISNPDILYEVSHLKSPTTNYRLPASRFPIESSSNPFLIGFALESNNLIKNAQRKLKEKKLDIIIANKVDSINSDKTTGAIIIKNKIEKFKNITKKLLAKKIISKIL